jgi:valyl-tRNA synthetase
MPAPRTALDAGICTVGKGKCMMERLFDFRSAAKRWNEIWEKADVFAPEIPSSKESFVIVLPPPNVTGILTVGHI